ncbi:MAG: two-component system OmpR family response regulator [Myxococcota bacterium]|jgi:two-component system OmpR family response regulator
MTAALNILLVDDEEGIRMIARMGLERIGGHQVQTSVNGQVALDLLRDDGNDSVRPDVILLDVMMPELDGPSLLRAIKADPKLADLDVIFLTAKVGVEGDGPFLALGAKGVIHKPFDPLTLAADVERRLGS